MRNFIFLLVVSIVTADKSDVKFRIDCWPEPGPNKANCESRGCTNDHLSNNTGPPNTPSCFMPREQMGYSATRVRDGEWKLTKNKGLANPWGGGDLPSLKFSYNDVGDSVINVRIEDNLKRLETGDLLNLPRATQSTIERLIVDVRDTSDPFSFQVKREDGQSIFDTSPGGLIFSDKFIQLAVQLPSSRMFGWGENVHPHLKVSILFTWSLRTTEQRMVITVPAPGYVYRTIGGILDIYLFPGPSPAEVIQQYTAFVGRSFLPPYWALGFQLCRYGYKSLDDMKSRVDAVRGYKIPFDVAYSDIDYMDRSKDFTIGANWAGFGDYVKQLHDWGMHNILIFDPSIEVDYDTFQRAIDKNASFLEWERPDEVPHDIQDLYPLVKNTKILLSVVWPDKHVAFPDFLDPQKETSEWWTDEFRRFHDQIAFDGAWIDMNEPAAFGTNELNPFYFDNDNHPNLKPLSCPLTGPDSEWDAPPYKTQAVYNFGKGAYLAVKTVCMRAMCGRGSVRQYDVHSLYGWSESRVTADAMRAATGKRGVVISRSTFPSSGRFGGHWLGDNTATWDDLRSAVIGVMEFNLFGIPYVGSDVCGFNGNTTEQLCLRWHQLGAFHSFYRLAQLIINHNTDDGMDQDPAVWESVAVATRNANQFRYEYLPYLYSLHYRASLYGDTVIRPLFFDFGSDMKTLEIDEQFMWGPSILVTPVLKENASTMQGYIPQVPGVSFYSLYSPDASLSDFSYGKKVASGIANFPALTTYNEPTLVRSGSIIPRQASAVTTVAARKGNLNLLIVPGEDTDRSATGELYWDDGDSIVEDIHTSFTKTSFNFSMTSTASTLTMTVAPVEGVTNPSLEFFEIFSYPTAVDFKKFTMNGETLSIDSQAF
ncbi:hypothetical protein PRIPAC_75365 [Pristionchus pacificus]|uniref:Glycoside hydrolase n=1 Tax=Pristionchus pacificus TaxID=54126 RepID=A0A2A6B4R2_PRIPA|nr:hypothetical protein PRIPAC_75365 [Pristionchus pacificus]|eukprot:PDM60848.1 glycoside hydrolase [Pristionchus pacificus]